MRKLLTLTAVVVVLASCGNAKHIAYFQDSKEADGMPIPTKKEVIIRPGNQISIVVNCKTAELSALYNLPHFSQRLGQTSNATISGSSNSSISGYTVDRNGFIDFPVLGRIKVDGMTMDQIARTIKEELRDQDQVKDAVVTVDLMNLEYEVLGEVGRPGRYAITKEGMTIIDAIAAAGDLTLYGKRNYVKVVRNEEGFQKTYELDLCSSRDILNSPAFYLQQDDIIYVEPNNMRKRQSAVNGNNIRSVSFWTGLVSLASTTTLLVLRLKDGHF